MKINTYARFACARLLRFSAALIATFALGFGLSLAPGARETGFAVATRANAIYFDMASGPLNFSVSPLTVNQITTNDNWSGVNSVEGYMGLNLTNTHGVDPQTVLHTEFANNQLPNTPTNVAANKSNPSAFNTGGLAEFDSGEYMALGFQGNVQANPYLVFYLNTVGRVNVTIDLAIQDIDGGMNDSVSRMALQYRIGETGLFTNLSAGYVADASDGGVAGRITNISAVLPADADNQPQVQVRLLMTNAANERGSSTPDEWVGVINLLADSSLPPTAAAVDVAGRVTTPSGRGISGARVAMYDQDGTVQVAVTSPSGYFRFSNVEVGRTYHVSIQSKRYSFSPRTITVHDELMDLNFVADE